MFIFTFKKAHEAAMAVKDAEIATLSRANFVAEMQILAKTVENRDLTEKADALDRVASMYRTRCVKAEAKVARMTSGLIPGGPRNRKPVLHHTAAAVASAAEVG